MPINIGNEPTDSHIFTGSINLSGGILLSTLESSHDLANGITVTQNNTRKGQIIITVDSSIPNQSPLSFNVFCNAVLATDAIAISIGSGSQTSGFISTGLAPSVGATTAGRFFVTAMNFSGQTIASDSKIIFNWSAM